MVVAHAGGVGAKRGVVSNVWVVDGNDNLNMQLVRKGACEAKTVLLNEEDEGHILIKEEVYKEFKKKVIEAETQAKKESLGIWASQKKGLDK